MKPINTDEAPNETIALLRRLAAEKRETQRQMREAFATDPEVKRIIEELDQNHAKKQRQTV